MSSIKLILKLQIRYYDEQSLFTDSDIDLYYLPGEKKVFKDNSFYEEEKKRIKETFLELDEGNYLVLKPVVSFKVIDSLSLNSDSYDEYDYDDLPAHLIFNDIVDDLGNFDNYGEKSLIFSIIMEEHWHQCWEGDWDCNSEYIGVINNDFKSENVITNKSKEKKKKRELEFKKWQYVY